MEDKYMEMLIAISKAIKERQESFARFGVIVTSTPGYRIKLKPSNDWFAKIDWLEANGYIRFGLREWCDITQSRVETYELTELGKEMVGGR